MKVSKLIALLQKAVAVVPDIEIQCRNGAGDFDYAEAIYLAAAGTSKNPKVSLFISCDIPESDVIEQVVHSERRLPF